MQAMTRVTGLPVCGAESSKGATSPSWAGRVQLNVKISTEAKDMLIEMRLTSGAAMSDIIDELIRHAHGMGLMSGRATPPATPPQLEEREFSFSDAELEAAALALGIELSPA